MTLAELVTARKGDRTFLDLADATDGRITAKRWSMLAALPIRDDWGPAPEQLRLMAEALGVPQDAVLAAIEESRRQALA
jgi:hypothetical protein